MRPDIDQTVEETLESFAQNLNNEAVKKAEECYKKMAEKLTTNTGERDLWPIRWEQIAYGTGFNIQPDHISQPGEPNCDLLGKPIRSLAGYWPILANACRGPVETSDVSHYILGDIYGVAPGGGDWPTVPRDNESRLATKALSRAALLVAALNIMVCRNRAGQQFTPEHNRYQLTFTDPCHPNRAWASDWSPGSVGERRTTTRMRPLYGMEPGNARI